jgi:membrane protein insertase Oxa1/YidC/SpoIIIJ
LPFSIQTARFAVAFQRIVPEVQTIRARHADDPLAAQQELAELFRRRNVSPWGRYAQTLLNLVFVIVGLFALAAFVPQIRLDHGRFLWIDDVTRYDTAIIVAVVAGVSSSAW